MDNLKDKQIDFSIQTENPYKSKDSETLLDSTGESRSKGLEFLQVLASYWEGVRDFKERRERNRKYYRGDQWHETITNPDTNETMTEGDYIASQGKTPISNNQIRQLVKNLLGQYRENDYKPVARARQLDGQASANMMSNTLQYVLDINEAKELDVRVFEEFLLSGAFGWKLGFDWMPERNMEEITIDALKVANLFWNDDISDSRLKDMKVIGEVHDMSIEDVLHRFGKNKDDIETIRDWYSDVSEEKIYGLADFGSERFNNIDFYIPYDNDKCRVIEVWRKELSEKMMVHDTADATIQQTDYTQEDIDLLNRDRIFNALESGFQPTEESILAAMEQGFTDEQEMLASALEMDGVIPLLYGELKNEYVWTYYFMTPLGDILESGETPLDNESHPYSLNLYPMVDSEVWSFIEDIIDIQQHINRLLSMLDFSMGAGAKGVLLIDENMLGEGQTPQDIADEWTKFNGVIAYKSKPNMQLPTQVTTNSTNVSGQQMLQMQLGLMKELSGINEAMQGQKVSNVNTASQYAQMTNNATYASKDYFEKFFNGRKNRDFKVVQMVQQYYKDKRYININGSDYDKESNIFDPEKANETNFDIVIGRSSNSPVYRDIIEDRLFQFLQSGMIDLPMFLENSNMPYSEKLMEQIKTKTEEVQQMQQQQGAVEGSPEQQAIMQQMMNGQG